MGGWVGGRTDLGGGVQAAFQEDRVGGGDREVVGHARGVEVDGKGGFFFLACLFVGVGGWVDGGERGGLIELLYGWAGGWTDLLH